MAKYEEITIDQGADVSIELHLVNQDGSVKDLTNHSLAAKLKRTYNSDSADTIVFTQGIYDPATAGKCSISLTNLQTDTLKAGRYVYDVELSFLDSDGDRVIERILEGHIHVTPSVTR
jgi:hypothetical protein